MTRARLFKTLFVCLVFVSCSQQEPAHIPKEKMVDVMTDIYLAEVYSSIVTDSAGHAAKKNMDSLARYYKTVLNHHNISVDEFSKNLRWYSDNPTELDSVYTDMLNELSTMEGMLNVGG